MTAKKIVVADDNGHWASQWRRLLDDRREGQFIVTHVNSPEAMRDHLAADPEVWLAVIDMDFNRASHKTGLHALMTAERNARERPKGRVLHTIVTTVDDADNRLLFLHTAFQCFDPPPVDLILKDNDFDSAVLDALGHLTAGGLPARTRYKSFAPGREDEPPMRKLLGGKCSKTGEPLRLTLWRTLGGITAEEGDVGALQQVQNATGIKSKHIYGHLRSALEGAQGFVRFGDSGDSGGMRFPPRAMVNAASPEKRKGGEVISPLREFAAAHALFFQAPELEEIVKERLLDPVRDEGPSRRWPGTRQGRGKITGS
ncbi:MULTISPECIES: hypothetical protein [unclassified Streptomyces]|uniref:hypothetical protein n=1 Tax=unclassified Streptomyces TaxID=2593676 RepID=UPI002E11A742|nr:hypothetical protein OG457_40600 [Streptomyces sp. NBC_01207]WTA22682.1 hypothetical protein OG365_34250 [Streptomyces sp. NBC_00853]